MNGNSIEINLDDDNHSQQSKHKRPPTLVYCGDGVLEEYSSSDEENENEEGKVELEAIEATSTTTQETQVDPKSLDWVPWMKHYAATSATKGLAACDFMGEKLAWWFGITQPKYLYEIEEYKRMQQEELENDSDTEEIELKTKRAAAVATTDVNQQQPSLASNQLFQA